jgi:hypothetical protein
MNWVNSSAARRHWLLMQSDRSDTMLPRNAQGDSAQDTPECQLVRQRIVNPKARYDEIMRKSPTQFHWQVEEPVLVPSGHTYSAS